MLNNDGTIVEVRNFLGEKINRVVDLPVGVTAVRSEKVKDEIVISGNDVDAVSQSGMHQVNAREHGRGGCRRVEWILNPSINPNVLLAALIHQKCSVKKKDIRKFLDGIYVSESGVIGETMPV